MTFRKFDAGVVDRPKHAPKGDCQVRALATATWMSWTDAWEVLYKAQKESKACHFTLVEELRNPNGLLRWQIGTPMDVKVLRQIDFPAKKGKSRMTGAEFCKKYKKGRFILRLAHHVVAVKDGVFYDLSDCTRSCVYTAWEIDPNPTTYPDVECSEGDGACEFLPDFECDLSGQTINCVKCGNSPDE